MKLFLFITLQNTSIIVSDVIKVFKSVGDESGGQICSYAVSDFVTMQYIFSGGSKEAFTN